MKPLTQVLVTLVLTCSLGISVPAGEISCGVEGKAPCVQQDAPGVDEIAEGTAETPDAGGATTWEAALALLQGIMSVF